MSEKIDQICEVARQVRQDFEVRSGRIPQRVTTLRRKAVASVAKRRGIYNQSVLDKFIRQLQPDVRGAAHFDMLLEAWLLSDSDQLKNILLKHKRDRLDEDIISNVL